jgi:hypothetical protein
MSKMINSGSSWCISRPFQRCPQQTMVEFECTRNFGSHRSWTVPTSNIYFAKQLQNAFDMCQCSGSVLCIGIFVHCHDTKAWPNDSSVRGDGSSEWYSLLRLILYHGVLSDLSCAMPLNGPCSTGVIGETVMPLARQASKSVHIIVSFASRLQHRWLHDSTQDCSFLQPCNKNTPKIALEMSFRQHQRLKLSRCSSGRVRNNGC